MILSKKIVKFYLVRKAFPVNRWAVFATVFLCLHMVNIQAQENKICIVETREYPGRDPVMWDGLYASSDGKVYSALINEGESAHFYVYDPKTDKNILLCDMAEFLDERGKGIRSTGKIHNKPVEDEEGNIYFWDTSKAAEEFHNGLYEKQSMYKDDNHLNYQGSGKLAEILLSIEKEGDLIPKLLQSTKQ